MEELLFWIIYIIIFSLLYSIKFPVILLISYLLVNKKIIFGKFLKIFTTSFTINMIFFSIIVTLIKFFDFDDDSNNIIYIKGVLDIIFYIIYFILVMKFKYSYYYAMTAIISSLITLFFPYIEHDMAMDFLDKIDK